MTSQNSFCVFLSKTVSPTNKSYNIGTPKVGVALSVAVDEVMMTSLMTSQNSFFVFFSKTVRPTNKSYKIGTPQVGGALQNRPIVLGGCVTNFAEIAKSTPKMA